MSGKIVLVAALAVLTAFFPLARADIAISTTTTVYFNYQGAPYGAGVNFTITCYGYSWRPGPEQEKPPGSYVPVNVFDFGAECPHYGCEVAENYYLNYRHIDYCDLNGTAGGKDFYIHDYSNRPVSDCDNNFDKRSCVLRFSIPPGTVPAPSLTPIQTATQRPSVQPTAAPARQEDLWSSLIRGIICLFKGLFGSGC